MMGTSHTALRCSLFDVGVNDLGKFLKVCKLVAVPEVVLLFKSQMKHPCTGAVSYAYMNIIIYRSRFGSDFKNARE